MKDLRIPILAVAVGLALLGVALSVGRFGDAGKALAWARQGGEAPQTQLWTGVDESVLFQGDEKPWLGVLIANLSSRIAEKLGLPAGTTGIAVVGVVPASPAADKLKKDDVITTLDGAAVSDVKTFKETIKTKKVGDKVTLTILRGGQTQTVEVTLGSQPQPRGGQFSQVLPELEGIPPQELFGHLIGGQVTYTDKDGNTVTLVGTAGTVVSVAENTITIDPSGPAGNATYNVTTSTMIPGRSSSLASLKAGDKVVILSKQGSQDALAITGALPIMGLGQMMPHFGARGQQMAPPRMMPPRGQGFFQRPGPAPREAPPAEQRFKLREGVAPNAS